MLTGCGSSDAGAEENEIELLEPLSASVSTEIVDYRNLYVYDIKEGAVYPELVEYSFQEDVSFGEYRVFPGESVSAGTVLAKADLTARDRQIKSLQDTIDNLNVTHSESVAMYQARIKTLEDTNSRLDSTVDYGKIMIQENLFAIERLESELESEEKLYELDLDYYQSQLNKLKSKNAEDTLRAKEAGVVVSISEYLENGSWVSSGSAVMAVATEGEQYFLFEYLPEKTMTKYKETYVVVNGRRYEAEYRPYDSEEYNRLVAKGENVCTRFRILDPEGTLEAGDKGLAVLMTDHRENTLSVPKESIHRDEGGNYVNTLENGQVVKAYVETGLTDGVYTEILEGLTYGQTIQLTEYRTDSGNTAVLERKDYGDPYTGTGSFVYPDTELVTNDLEYGTVTMTELLVEKYQTVNKGDVIATIQVEKDPVALAEQELRLQRLREKLEDTQKELEKLDVIEIYNDHRNQRTSLNNTVASLQRQIASAEETLNRMKSDYGTRSLKAPISGMVTRVTDRLAGAVLSSGEVVAAIASPDTVYLSVSNAKRSLQYGHHLTVTYEDDNGNEQQALGTVVTVTPEGLSRSLWTDSVYVRLEGDAAAVMAPTEAKHLSPYLSKVSYQVDGTDNVITDVVIVPLKAVKVLDDQTYVTVLNEDGTRTMRSFIAGGFSTAGYWVVEGLEEGMTVCLD
jgi:multidrug efflux pump subunit AcrA (membrane-fusion protein)